MKVCINQLHRPKIHVEVEGVGNCSICMPNKHNKNCKNYRPVNTLSIKVKNINVKKNKKRNRKKK